MKRHSYLLICLLLVLLFCTACQQGDTPGITEGQGMLSGDEQTAGTLGTEDEAEETGRNETEAGAETRAKITRFEITHEPGTIYGALDRYFSDREKVFNGELDEVEADPELDDRFHKWVARMEFDIQTVGVSYGVSEVWYNSETTVKLLVYEGISVDYGIKKTGETDYFWIGGDQLVELTNTDGGWKVTGVSCNSNGLEFLDCNAGSEEDYSRLRSPHWRFDSGNIPKDFGTPTDEFKTTVQSEIDRQAAGLLANKADWFDDYSGETLQRIPSPNQELNRPWASGDVIFYQAEEGEAVEDIAVKMIDALMESFINPTDGREFTMTGYQLDMERMEILDKAAVDERIIEELWKAWQCDEKDYQVVFEKYLPRRLYYLGDSAYSGCRPLGEDTWLITSLEGSYHYGDRELIHIEQQGAAGSDTRPFAYTRESSYILMREGSVYRLQRAAEMGYDWEWNGIYWKN